MKKLIVLLAVIFTLSAGELSAQQSLRFGNVSLKDTSGSVKTNGGIYTDFIELNSLRLKTDIGTDLIFSGQNMGLLIFMGNNIAEFHPNGLNTFVPIYPSQYSSSEISGLSVDNGAMIIDSDTGELLIFLNDTWNTVAINPK